MNEISIGNVDLTQLRRVADAVVAGLPSRPPLPGSFCLCLSGTLGAGKTRFVQELILAFGGESASVTSPTFTLVQTYCIASEDAGLKLFHHLDLYRVADADELWELGIDELLEQPYAFTVIEWADRFRSELPEQAVWLDVQHDGESADGTRRLVWSCSQPETAVWLKRIFAAI